MEMYRDGIACVARRPVTTQIGWTMEHFKALFSVVATIRARQNTKT
jgi:hypothetical protein